MVFPLAVYSMGTSLRIARTTCTPEPNPARMHRPYVLMVVSVLERASRLIPCPVNARKPGQCCAREGLQVREDMEPLLALPMASAVGVDTSRHEDAVDQAALCAALSHACLRRRLIVWVMPEYLELVGS